MARLSPGESGTRRPDVLLHLVLLAVSCLVILLAALLQVGDDQRVRLSVLQFPVPALCSYRRLLGLDCPGCGLTRCFISLAHGNWRAAWQYNPAGILLFGLVCSQLPYRLAQLARAAGGWSELRPGRWAAWPLWIVLTGLLLQWMIRSAQQLLS